MRGNGAVRERGEQRSGEGGTRWEWKREGGVKIKFSPTSGIHV
jgi:hypothetical protein